MPTALILIAAYAALRLLNPGESIERALWGIASATTLIAAGALIRHRRRRTPAIVWAADDSATQMFGAETARRTLRDHAPQLYRTKLHSWMNTHTSSSTAACIRRLEERYRPNG